MPLDTEGLANTIKSIMTDMAERTYNPELARNDFATQLAEAISVFVESGTVFVTVTTSGGDGSGTGNIT